MIMPFGKYQGVELSEVPDRYLEWAASLASLEPDLERAIGDELLDRSLRRLLDRLSEARSLEPKTLRLLREHLPACARAGVSRFRLTELRRAITRLEKAADAAD